MAASIIISITKPVSVTTESADKPFYTTVSSKGQVVIPAAIRHELGIEPGTQLAMRVEGGKVVVVPQKKLTWRDLRGLTSGGPSMTDELLEERRKDLERETAEGW